MIGFEDGILTKAEFVDEHEVTLPLHLHMSKENIEGVTDAIGEIFQSQKY